jgi:tRNA threonylcarbamoyladenosine biosynthesis protein TsaB
MPVILHIETATQVCSVALSTDGRLSQIRETQDKNSHSAVITIFIDEIMKAAELPFTAIDAVAVSKGPGSYTGLRIGVSTAKGICYALDKPLIAVGTLQSMAAGAIRGMESLPGGTPSLATGTPSLATGTPSLPVLLCPMIDARRMEVYNGLFDINLQPAREIRAEIITGTSFEKELEHHQIWFFGDGADKCKPFLGNHPNALFIEDFRISASFMVNLVEEKFKRAEFEDVVYFEPYYLKDFIPGIPKVKGLRN